MLQEEVWLDYVEIAQSYYSHDSITSEKAVNNMKYVIIGFHYIS